MQQRHMDSAACALLAFALISFAGCGKSSPVLTDPPPPEVTVSNPVVREVTDYFEFPGQTCAVGEVEVRARVTGYIVKVNFEDGQEVKKGDLLFEIDPRPYQAALDRNQGELTRLKAVREKAEADLARSNRLRPSGAISEDEYEQHVAQLAIAKASIQTAEAAGPRRGVEPGIHKSRFAHRRPREQGQDHGRKPGSAGHGRRNGAHKGGNRGSDLRIF